MLPVVTANYSYIVMQVVSTGEILQYLPYQLLELFCCHIDAIEKSLISIQAIRGCKRGYVTCVRVELYQMKRHV